MLVIAYYVFIDRIFPIVPWGHGPNLKIIWVISTSNVVSHILKTNKY